MLRLLPALLLAQSTAAFFFGGGGGCGCQPQPACAPPVPASPCSGGSVVSGYAGPPQGGYALPQQGFAAPQQAFGGAPQQNFFQGGQSSFQGGYQGGLQGGYQQNQVAPSGGGYQQGPGPVPQQPQQQAPQFQQAQPAQQVQQAQQAQQPQGYAEQAPQQTQQVEEVQTQQATPQENYQGEQQVAVSSVAREEPNYQSTSDAQNIVEAAQAAAEYGHNKGAAAAAAKVAEVIEEDEPRSQNLKKEEGKSLNKKKPIKTTTTKTAPTTTATSTAATMKTEFPVGEEIIPEGNEKEIDVSELHLTDDPLCNSDELRKVVIDNIDDQLNSSKRMIQLAAEAQFGGRFDVICANGDFSYVTNTELYCQETKADISCYTYRQL